MNEDHLLLSGLWDYAPAFSSGGQRAFWELALALAADHRVTVLAFVRKGSRGDFSEELFTADNPVLGGVMRIFRTRLEDCRHSPLGNAPWDLRILTVERRFHLKGVLSPIAAHLIFAQPSFGGGMAEAAPGGAGLESDSRLDDPSC